MSAVAAPSLVAVPHETEGINDKLADSQPGQEQLGHEEMSHKESEAVQEEATEAKDDGVGQDPTLCVTDSDKQEVKSEKVEDGSAGAEHEDVKAEEVVDGEGMKTEDGDKGNEEEGSDEPQAKKPRTAAAALETSRSPSCEGDVKQEEDTKTSSQDPKEDTKSDKRNSDRETPQVSEEPRNQRSARGSSRKAVASRQLVNKNFLKAVLPNITRLSRTEILQDLRMMEGNAKARA